MQSRRAGLRLQAIQKSLTLPRSFVTSAPMTFAKPADSLKAAKIHSREELKDPKWVHLEAIKWETPNGTQVYKLFEQNQYVAEIAHSSMRRSTRNGTGWIERSNGILR